MEKSRAMVDGGGLGGLAGQTKQEQNKTKQSPDDFLSPWI